MVDEVIERIEKRNGEQVIVAYKGGEEISVRPHIRPMIGRLPGTRRMAVVPVGVSEEELEKEARERKRIELIEKGERIVGETEKGFLVEKKKEEKAGYVPEFGEDLKPILVPTEEKLGVSIARREVTEEGVTVPIGITPKKLGIVPTKEPEIKEMIAEPAKMVPIGITIEKPGIVKKPLKPEVKEMEAVPKSVFEERQIRLPEEKILEPTRREFEEIQEFTLRETPGKLTEKQVGEFLEEAKRGGIFTGAVYAIEKVPYIGPKITTGIGIGTTIFAGAAIGLGGIAVMEELGITRELEKFGAGVREAEILGHKPFVGLSQALSESPEIRTIMGVGGLVFEEAPKVTKEVAKGIAEEPHKLAGAIAGSIFVAGSLYGVEKYGPGLVEAYRQRTFLQTIKARREFQEGVSATGLRKILGTGREIPKPTGYFEVPYSTEIKGVSAELPFLRAPPKGYPELGMEDFSKFVEYKPEKVIDPYKALSELEKQAIKRRGMGGESITKQVQRVTESEKFAEKVGTQLIVPEIKEEVTMAATKRGIGIKVPSFKAPSLKTGIPSPIKTGIAGATLAMFGLGTKQAVGFGVGLGLTTGLAGITQEFFKTPITIPRVEEVPVEITRERQEVLIEPLFLERTTLEPTREIPPKPPLFEPPSKPKKVEEILESGFGGLSDWMTKLSGRAPIRKKKGRGIKKRYTPTIGAIALGIKPITPEEAERIGIGGLIGLRPPVSRISVKKSKKPNVIKSKIKKSKRSKHTGGKRSAKRKAKRNFFSSYL